MIIGAAMQRGDFKAGLDTPVLKYFDTSKVKNVDDRKRRMTLRDLLTMTAGLDWNDEGFDTGDPQNDTSLMEVTDDWVQYAIDKPMAAEPGKVWNYNSGATELLAYIFQKETGQDIDDYGQKYLFAPLGIRHEWKRTYLGVVDTEGGLYLNGGDLAKIGYLYLHDGMWDGQRILSSQWVKESVAPHFQTSFEPQFKGFKYGFKWWLYKLPDSTEYDNLSWIFSQKITLEILEVLMSKNEISAALAGTIRLGDELSVHRLGFGAMRLTGEGIWGPPKDRKTALAVLRRALELGVNFIDTADSYGPNVSEELIAEALYPYPAGVVIATKGGWNRPGPNQWTHDATPSHLRSAVEGSLKRLRLERIDVYQLHIPDPVVSFDDSVGTLAQ